MTDKEKYGRKHPHALASKESVLQAQLEEEDIPLRRWRASVADHRNYHFDGGRRPLERKRGREELKEQFGGSGFSQETSKKIKALIPEDRSNHPDLLRKVKGRRYEEESDGESRIIHPDDVDDESE